MSSLAKMDPESRVWIYQANRFLTSNETELIQERCKQFVGQWQAHGASLDAQFELFHNLFVVFAVNEKSAGVTGCSIDSSVKFMQSLGDELKVDFFDRMLITYRKQGEIVQEKMHDFWALRKAKLVNDDTIVFDNLVKNLGEFSSRWETRFDESWHASMW